MQSQYGHVYNHDPWAHNYDRNVQNEADPIRTGYEATLDWVIEQANIHPADCVLELGSGTGNLTVRIPECRQITCVDLSEKMTTQARAKLAGCTNIHFVQADVLAYLADDSLHAGAPQFQADSPQFQADSPQFDVLVSTYTIHHLTEPEKQQLFAHIHRRLRPGGRAVFGDLMIADQATELRVQQHFRDIGQPEVAEDIDEEFFWYVDAAQAGLAALGFQVQIERFSALSWGIAALKLD
ncbi:MAG: class I SAM-dependent methyltransferase [Caldilineaceae bacterium]|nr:class I SAM-dependent methyltransferase [Caldilineaceae bacterium]